MFGTSKLVNLPRHFGVTADDVRNNSRISHDLDDEVFGRVLASAYEYIQEEAQVAILPSVWVQSQPCFQKLNHSARWGITLARSPAVNIISVSYLDTDGTEQTVTNSEYRLDWNSLRPSVVETPGGSFPAGILDAEDAIRVKYTAGNHVRFTIDDSANEIAPSDNRFKDGDRIRFSNATGNLPTPLDDSVDYYVVNRTNAAFQVALSVGGAAIDITDAGTGDSVIDWMTAGFKQCVLMVASYWYENPEAFSIKTMHHDLGIKLSSLIVNAGGQVSYA